MATLVMNIKYIPYFMNKAKHKMTEVLAMKTVKNR